MLLEILHFAFVLFGLFEGCECAQIAALPCLRIFLSRIQAKLSGFEFANHTFLKDAALCRSVASQGPLQPIDRHLIETGESQFFASEHPSSRTGGGLRIQ
jgi:hypothetical protein